MISNLRLLIPYGANKEEYWRYISGNTKLAVMPILPICVFTKAKIVSFTNTENPLKFRINVVFFKHV